ncbi:MAG TPA: hypothetical protein VFF73_20980 [Planctomycetota bacterium]|nr:hypothetical protein [Planctomycetota bacterium]
MSDEDLRALARLAGTDGGAAVLRYIAALERAGRRTEALAALSAGRAHPDVLAEVRRRAGPLRGSPQGSAWSSGPAITRSPVVRWKRSVRVAGSRGVEYLLGNAFGIVLAWHDEQRSNLSVVIIDPETAEIRGSPKPFEGHIPCVAVVEDTALYVIGREAPGGSTLVSLDLVTGATLWEAPWSWAVLLAAIETPRIPPPQNLPETAGAMRFPWEAGRFTWSAYRHGGETTLSLGDDGPVVWRTSLPRWASWDGSDFIVFMAADSRGGDHLSMAIVIVDATGETGRVRLETGDSPGSPAICDRTVYCVIRHGRSLVAFDTKGRTLWERPLDPVGTTGPRLLSMSSRLYLVAQKRDDLEITCLEEPP